MLGKVCNKFLMQLEVLGKNGMYMSLLFKYGVLAYAFLVTKQDHVANDTTCSNAVAWKGSLASTSAIMGPKTSSLKMDLLLWTHSYAAWRPRNFSLRLSTASTLCEVSFSILLKYSRQQYWSDFQRHRYFLFIFDWRDTLRRARFQFRFVDF